MTTALDILSRSLRMLGVYSAGESLSAEEGTDGLAALNALVAEMSNGAMVYAKTLDSIALTANQTSVTVGPSGATLTARPVRVLPESYIDLSGVSYPLEMFTLQQYNEIGVKAQTGIPVGLWVQTDMPNVTITPWPIPSQAMTLKLWSDKVFASFPSLTTVLSLPPGYENGLAAMLAVEVADEYEVAPSPSVMMKASRARRVLKRRNTQVPRLTLDVPGCGYVADWRSGA